VCPSSRNYYFLFSKVRPEGVVWERGWRGGVWSCKCRGGGGATGGGCTVEVGRRVQGKGMCARQRIGWQENSSGKDTTKLAVRDCR